MGDIELGRTLLGLARRAIATRLGLPAPEPRHHQALLDPGATFVTLTHESELRGCIGSLEARRPLGVDVTENALAAAFRDPRFTPLQLSEYERISVEVSLLGPTLPLEVADEQDLLRQLRPEVDGVIFEFGYHRSTFLPQVWQSLPEPRLFVAHLKRKAGLPADFWDARVKISRYEVIKWKESDLTPVH